MPYALARRVSNLQTEVSVSKKWVEVDVYILIIYQYTTLQIITMR